MLRTEAGAVRDRNSGLVQDAAPNTADVCGIAIRTLGTRVVKTLLCIPTLNAGSHLALLLPAIRSQTLQPDKFVVVDSSSNDDTVAAFKAAGAQVHVIPRAKFNHGDTRQLVVEMSPEAEFIIFLTQDAIPAHSEAFEHLVGCFRDPEIGAVYGRQLPRPAAGPIEAHARLFNYPTRSHVRSSKDSLRLGFKTAFLSNSFAAYRRTALVAIGGFPRRVIFGEDSFAAAKLILSGWRVAYCAEAKVYHSHDYTLFQELRRYFDVGVFHAQQAWIREQFGAAEGEGLRFLRSELRYLSGENSLLIPSAVARTALKYAGYRLGRIEGKLPVGLKRALSQNRGYWSG